MYQENDSHITKAIHAKMNDILDKKMDDMPTINQRDNKTNFYK